MQYGFSIPGYPTPLFYCFTHMRIYLSQCRSHNVEKVTLIKGRLLDQEMILLNCAPFQNGNSLWEQILSFMSSLYILLKKSFASHHILGLNVIV